MSDNGFETIETHRLPNGGLIGLNKNYIVQVGKTIVDPYQNDEIHTILIGKHGQDIDIEKADDFEEN